MTADKVHIRYLGQQDYLSCWHAMREFTDERNEETPDEIWLLEHPAVFTQGQKGKPEHLLNPGSIPVVPIDRGGQITYHGPGQLVVYALINLKRKKLNIREFVTILEQSIITVLKSYGIVAESQCKAPGIYVDGKKICSIGLRVRRGCSYHGLAFNIDMDLEPFSRINPCGFQDLKMTQLVDLVKHVKMQDVQAKLVHALAENLGYREII